VPSSPWAVCLADCSFAFLRILQRSHSHCCCRTGRLDIVGSIREAGYAQAKGVSAVEQTASVLDLAQVLDGLHS
jgi:hypothetical protein